MFERYTEHARRVIFFARYEASQFGSASIESEHFLLGLIREDKALIDRLGNTSAVDAIRKEIEGQTTIRQKTSTSIDLPLSRECQRILAYAETEAERLGQRDIGTEHLLFGILREEPCLAARILRNDGVHLEAVRKELEKLPAMGSLSAQPEISIALSRALGQAIERARALGHARVTAGHLLLILLSDEHPEVSKFLARHGITSENIQLDLLPRT